MASVIKPKRRISSPSPPTVAELADGEMAVNILSQQIFVREGSSIVEVANVGGGGGTIIVGGIIDGGTATTTYTGEPVFDFGSAV